MPRRICCLSLVDDGGVVGAAGRLGPRPCCEVAAGKSGQHWPAGFQKKGPSGVVGSDALNFPARPGNAADWLLPAKLLGRLGIAAMSNASVAESRLADGILKNYIPRPAFKGLHVYGRNSLYICLISRLQNGAGGYTGLTCLSRHGKVRQEILLLMRGTGCAATADACWWSPVDKSQLCLDSYEP